MVEVAPFRRFAVAALGVAAGTVLLSACAAGQLAQTADVTGVNDANDAAVGSMAVRAVAVAAPTSNFYAKGASAQLIGVFVNTGPKPDVLTSITSPAFSGWSIVAKSSASATPLAASSSATAGSSSSAASGSSGGHVPIPADTAVSYGVPVATSVIQVSGIKRALYPGDEIKVTFTFQRAGAVTAEVPVQLTTTPGSAVVGSTPSTPAGAGAASEPASAGG